MKLFVFFTRTTTNEVIFLNEKKKKDFPPYQTYTFIQILRGTKTDKYRKI